MNLSDYEKISSLVEKRKCIAQAIDKMEEALHDKKRVSVCTYNNSLERYEPIETLDEHSFTYVLLGLRGQLEGVEVELNSYKIRRAESK